MNRTCVNCGAESASEARFCRKCGAPLRVTSGMGEGSETVSPKAATIPLSDDVRTTDGLPADDPHRHAQQTARVASSELDRMLRPDQQSSQQQPQPAPFDPYKTVVANPQSGALGDGGEYQRSATTGELVERGSASSPLPPTPRAPDGDEDFDVTRPANTGDFDEEMTIMSPRQSRPFESGQTPARVQPSPGGAPSAGHAAASAQGASAASSQAAAAQAAAVRR
ncbi:MAG TPA: zinc ribbon domain-containing protein, partial [Pyrinomonadaceae bacterium]|nr:zinc ribbon domain-containing protein [Pyrinomonadaceae bacterium]